MRTIIKSADPAMGLSVRTIPVRAAAPAVEPEPNDDRQEQFEHRIAGLEARIVAMAEEATELRAEADEAFRRGQEQGRESGRLEAEDREQERMDLLEAAIGASRRDFAEALGVTERLAAFLARKCLDKLFGDATNNADRVCALLHAHMSRIEQHELVGVAVSAADFTEEALDRLHAIVPGRVVEICLDPLLPTGSCRLRPRLGEIDIGLDTQWQAVGQLLSQIAAGDLPPC